MQCDKCQSANVEVTTMSSDANHSMFYDNNGNKHHHNNNTTVRRVICRDCEYVRHNRIFHSCWCGWTQPHNEYQKDEEIN